MTWLNDKFSAMSQGARLACGAGLLAIGVAGGASAAKFTRAGIEMAPTVITPIGKLADSNNIVTIKARVAETYGDRMLVTDGSGKTMVDLPRDAATNLVVGSMIAVQGRYADGQLRASFLIAPNGQVEAVGPGPGGPRPGPHQGPGPHGPELAPPPDSPPPPGCASVPPAIPAPEAKAG